VDAQPWFSPSRFSSADRILLGAGGLFLIDLLLPWNRACSLEGCLQARGWEGPFGFLAGVLVIALLLWEGIRLAGVVFTMSVPRAAVTVGAAGGLLLVTPIRLLVKPSIIPLQGRSLFAWLALLLALSLAYGAWMKWVEEAVDAGGVRR
jgi:hypothetical protein